jgi:hypothetical protein
MGIIDLIWEGVGEGDEVLYESIQAGLEPLPDAVRNRLSATMPYWADEFAPGVYFAPPPHLPPETGQSDGMWIYQVWGAQGLHLLPLVYDARIPGTVKAVEPFNPGYKWRHQTFYLDPDDHSLLNGYSSKMGMSWHGAENCIKCEAPPNFSALPTIGERLFVIGAFCIDLAWGWTDIAVRQLEVSETKQA